MNYPTLPLPPTTMGMMPPPPRGYFPPSSGTATNLPPSTYPGSINPRPYYPSNDNYNNDRGGYGGRGRGNYRGNFRGGRGGNFNNNNGGGGGGGYRGGYNNGNNDYNHQRTSQYTPRPPISNNDPNIPNTIPIQFVPASIDITMSSTSESNNIEAPILSTNE